MEAETIINVKITFSEQDAKDLIAELYMLLELDQCKEPPDDYQNVYGLISLLKNAC